jgi:hypothetical protein
MTDANISNPSKHSNGAFNGHMASKFDVPDAPKKSHDFQAFWDGEEIPKPTPALIKRVLPRDGLVLIGGRSGAGKSYVALYLSVCLAAMRPFCGRAPRMQSAVLYIAAEGGANMVPRIAAAKKAAGITENLPIRVIRRAAFPAGDSDFSEYVAHVAAEVAVMRKRTGIRHVTIPIDTVSAAFELADEDAASEVVKLCKRARQIADACDALVILVHHFGKDDDRLFRGSSAWRDNVDHALAIMMERKNKTAQTEIRNLNIEKSRIGPEGPLSGFALREIDIGLDEDGDIWAEAYVAPVAYADVATAAAAQKESRGGKVLRDSFNEALRTSGQTHSVQIGGPGNVRVKAVTQAAVRDEFMRRYPAESEETSAKAWRREMAQIAKSGFGYATERDKRNVAWIWRPKDQPSGTHLDEQYITE